MLLFLFFYRNIYSSYNEDLKHDLSYIYGRRLKHESGREQERNK